ncbi:MAG: helix-turn-helix domain-containing protein, partial [Deltaproteobacteria bacterium]|nr:helix-turn-helix domain-containing protein [Deltaproteobacteria bacterium]
RLIVEHPEIAQSVMARLAARVRDMSVQRTLLALPNPFQRLCVQLLLLASHDRLCLDPAPTHQELAMMINTSRETVTRAFQALMLHETIRRDGGRLLLLRRDYLEDIGAGRVEPPRT